MEYRLGMTFLAASLLLGGCISIESRSPGGDDAAAVRAVDEAYVSGWRGNDRTAVMATLSDDAVLLPQDMAPIRGSAEIEDYWWPAGRPTTIVTEYENSVHELDVSGDMAYVRGTADLTFEWETGSGVQQQSSRSAYLMVLRRDSDGSWKITHRMWGRVPN